MANFKINDGIVIDFTIDGWAEFKKWINGTYGQLRYTWVDEGPAYDIVAIDDHVYRTCSINKSDAQEFEAVFKDYKPIRPVTEDGKPFAVQWPTEGTRANITTHNWCDKTTWWYDSAEVIDEVATDSGDHTVYTLAHQNVIDSYHGKITNEVFQPDTQGHTLRVAVKVNDVAKTEQDPHYGAGGDFVVAYATGTITFLATLQPADVVKVTYHYARSSLFVLKPAANQRLCIRRAETQFAKSVEITDTIKYEVWGTPPGAPGKMLLSALYFKTLLDFINDATGAVPPIPRMGGDSWRGMPDDVYIFPWAYADSGAMICLLGSWGMELQVSAEHDEPFGGGFCTATFYCVQE